MHELPLFPQLEPQFPPSGPEGRDTWGTPRKLGRTLVERYSLNFDAAAAEHNALCRHYWTIEDNALEQSWRGKRIWCNPPYSNLRVWVAKFVYEVREGGCPVVAALMPNRPESVEAWWMDAVLGCHEWWGFDKRIDHIPPDGIKPSSPMHGSALYLFCNDTPLGRGRWMGFLNHKTGMPIAHCPYPLTGDRR